MVVIFNARRGPLGKTNSRCTLDPSINWKNKILLFKSSKLWLLIMVNYYIWEFIRQTEREREITKQIGGQIDSTHTCTHTHTYLLSLTSPALIMVSSIVINSQQLQRVLQQTNYIQILCKGFSRTHIHEVESRTIRHTQSIFH